jgi:hypothetical protein
MIKNSLFGKRIVHIGFPLLIRSMDAVRSHPVSNTSVHSIKPQQVPSRKACGTIVGSKVRLFCRQSVFSGVREIDIDDDAYVVLGYWRCCACFGGVRMVAIQQRAQAVRVSTDRCSCEKRAGDVLTDACGCACG